VTRSDPFSLGGTEEESLGDETSWISQLMNVVESEHARIGINGKQTK
jgi:hypothetical protein